MDDPPDDKTGPLVNNLNDDIDVIREYWKEFPGELVDLRVTRGNNDHVTILLWTRDDLVRETDLRSKLTYGDELEIQYSKWPLSKLDQINSDIQEIWASGDQGIFRSMDQFWGAIRVGLRADQEPLAARLVESYDDAVEITLGDFPYPLERSEHSTRIGQHPRAPLQVPAEISFPNLEINLELSSSTVRAGDDGHGKVRLRNKGLSTIEFESGAPLVGSVLDPLTGGSVGGFNGAIAGVGLRINLANDEETTIGVVFGTASVALEMGYVLQPGEYLVKVNIPVTIRSIDGSIDHRIIQVLPVALIVVGT